MTRKAWPRVIHPSNLLIMIDHQFTLKLKHWLEEKEHTEHQDIIEGAMMLLQLNKNQAMFNTIVRRPERFVEKIKYELNKFLPMRLAKMTLADVKELDDEITPVITAAIEAEPEDNTTKIDDEKILPLRGGKRTDHDNLPVEIQNIWGHNADRWKKIKEAFNTCKALEKVCDRFEYLMILKDLWYKYKADFDIYDSYVVPSDNSENKEANSTNDPLKAAKNIGNARSYISKNIDKLIALQHTSEDPTAGENAMIDYQNLRKKMYDRVLVITANGEVIGEEVLSKLSEAGIEMNSNDEQEEPDSESSKSAQ